MTKTKTTQVWEVKASWVDGSPETAEMHRLIRRDLMADQLEEVEAHWNDSFELEFKLTDEGMEDMAVVEETIPQLEERALSIISDLLQDDDDLIEIIGDIATRVCNYDARAEDVDDMSIEYDRWFSTYTNVQNRIMSKFIHIQFYPRDFRS